MIDYNTEGNLIKPQQSDGGRLGLIYYNTEGNLIKPQLSELQYF